MQKPLIIGVLACTFCTVACGHGASSLRDIGGGESHAARTSSLTQPSAPAPTQTLTRQPGTPVPSGIVPTTVQSAWTQTSPLKVGSDSNSAVHIALSASGDRYIVGETNTDGTTGHSNGYVAHLSSSGTLIWSEIVGSPVPQMVNGQDQTGTWASGVAVDPSGLVLVTGWTNAGLNGNILTGKHDAFIAAYDQTGTLKWLNEIGTAGQDMTLGAVTVDGKGGVYAVGASSIGMSVGIFKFDLSGNVIWKKSIAASAPQEAQEEGSSAISAGGAVAASDNAVEDLPGATVPQNLIYAIAGSAITLDSSGSVIISGTTQASLDGTDNSTAHQLYFAAKFDPSGNQLWLRQGGDGAWGYGVAVDSSDNIYLVGEASYESNNGTYQNNGSYLLEKLDPSGNNVWTQEGAQGPEYSYSAAQGIAIDAHDHIYVVGTQQSSTNNAETYQGFFAEFDTDGNLAWLSPSSMGSDGDPDFTAVVGVFGVAVGGTGAPVAVGTTISGTDLKDSVTSAFVGTFATE